MKKLTLGVAMNIVVEELTFTAVEVRYISSA